jgi:hypothetical protein
MVIEFLTFIPQWVIYTAAGISGCLVILSHLFSFTLIKYAFLIKPVSYILLITSIWLSGFAAYREYNEKKVQELETRLKIAQEQAAVINTQVEYIIQERVRTVKDVQVVVKEKIKEVEVLIDSKCEIDPMVNKLHNAAAKNVTKEIE